MAAVPPGAASWGPHVMGAARVAVAVAGPHGSSRRALPRWGGMRVEARTGVAATTTSLFLRGAPVAAWLRPTQHSNKHGPRPEALARPVAATGVIQGDKEDLGQTIHEHTIFAA
jgi:hypothetical protein